MAEQDSAGGTRAWALVIAGLLGATGVAAGAFGAHGLAERVGEAQLAWWRTGAQYHLIHALALLGVGAARLPANWTRRCTVGFTFGVAVFAGTLYAMALGGPRWLGAVTPIGGASLIASWCLLAFAAWSKRRGDY